jgi:hypothetical protein
MARKAAAKNRPPRYRDDPGIDPAASLTRAVGRLVSTFILLGLVAYVAAVVIARTDGFRSLIVEDLERRLGGSVRIGETRMTPRGVLCLQRVELCGNPARKRDGAPGAFIRAEKIEIPPAAWWGRGHVNVRGLEAHWRQGADRWEPAAFAGEAEALLAMADGEIPTLNERAGWAPLFRAGSAGTGLDLEADDLQWTDFSGSLRRRMGGVSLRTAYADAFPHPVQHIFFEAATVHRPTAPYRRVRCELIYTPGRWTVIDQEL